MARVLPGEFDKSFIEPFLRLELSFQSLFWRSFLSTVILVVCVQGRGPTYPRVEPLDMSASTEHSRAYTHPRSEDLCAEPIQSSTTRTDRVNELIVRARVCRASPLIESPANICLVHLFVG